MTKTNLTELALRAAVNTQQDPSLSGSPFANIKKAAINRAEGVIQGDSTLSNMASQLNVQTLAISTAVKGLELAYAAIKNQIAQLNNARLAFDQARLAGIATFIIPTNKIENELSIHELIIKTFMDLISRNPLFASYFGIQKSTSAALQDAEFHSVLPFYRMSESLAQPVSSTRAIDKQRIAINLFFKSALPEAIADIDNEFQGEYPFIEFWKSAYQKENYLNDLRSQRFLMMSLANLLWNLQHPVDPETGFPFSVDKNIELCREASLFLNKLLNPNEKSYVKPLDPDNLELISFVRQVEMHIKYLRAAFVEEQLNELNMTDLTNSAHQTLRIMDKSVFELIYSRINPITNKQEPDAKAAEQLAYMISYLNQLIIHNNDLLLPFNQLIRHAKDTPFLNTPIKTLLDALIVFIHTPTDYKIKFWQALEANTTDAAIEFARTLSIFNKKFVKPIKDVCKVELKSTVLNRKRKEVSALVARRLIPLITLVIEDYRVDIHTHFTNIDHDHELDTGAASSRGSPYQNQQLFSGKEQIHYINKLAARGNGYYVWELSPFISLNKDTEDELDKLPSHQYRFTEITKLLDAISEIVLHYRHFLQLKLFQQFLIKCLNKIREEYNELESHIGRVDALLNKDKAISRNMQAILGPMTKDISAGLNGFETAFTSFEQTISAPEFTEQEKSTLSIKIDFIHQQYSSLFREDSGISSFSDQSLSNTSALESIRSPFRASAPGLAPVSAPKRIIALRNLITQCIDALSFQSKHSEKGTLLNNLLKLLDAEEQMGEEQIYLVIKELAKISLSYRSTYFFQAQYGETRSAKVIIAAIKSPELNKLLPLKSLLIGENIDLSAESDANIAQRLRGYRAQNQWKESVDQIEKLMALA